MQRIKATLERDIRSDQAFKLQKAELSLVSGNVNIFLQHFARSPVIVKTTSASLTVK